MAPGRVWRGAGCAPGTRAITDWAAEGPSRGSDYPEAVGRGSLPRCLQKHKEVCLSSKERKRFKNMKQPWYITILKKVVWWAHACRFLIFFCTMAMFHNFYKAHKWWKTNETMTLGTRIVSDEDPKMQKQFPWNTDRGWGTDRTRIPSPLPRPRASLPLGIVHELLGLVLWLGDPLHPRSSRCLTLITGYQEESFHFWY